MLLTNAKVQAAKPGPKPYKLHDTGGLYLLVGKSGSKLWRLKYRIDGRENVFALGEFFADAKRAGHVTLDAARRARDEARELIREGVHPSHQRKARLRKQIAQNKNTFEAVAREWMARKASAWADSTYNQVKTVLETDVFPTIGSRPISSVTAADLLEIIRRVEGRGANT